MLKEYKFVFVIVLVLCIAWVVSFLLRKTANGIMSMSKHLDENEVTRWKFLKNSISLITFSLAIAYIFYEIPVLSSLGKALFAGAGVIAAIIGFASQKAFSNIVSGIFILIFKPFRIGDVIEVASGRKGLVEDITLRHTVIKDYENRRVIIPNSVISDETIINSNIGEETIRKQILFSIGYSADIDRAMKIIQEEAMAHRHSFDGRTAEEKAEGHPAVVVRVISLSESSVDLLSYIWSVGNDEAFVMKCDLLKSVKERFDKEEIEIPFPQRVVINRSELTD